ncbi:MAG: porin [Gammaproteobacteria bacterium]|nr:MAG: porin [Gammaproteobacteria bacterium]
MGKQFKQTLLAFAGTLGLVCATGTAHAIGPLEVAGWELSFSGNVNGFFTSSKCEPDNDGEVVEAGLACGSNGNDRDVTAIQTGLLPSWFGFNAKTTQNDFDIGVTIGYQPGISTNNKIGNGDLNSAFGLNNSNFRQVFLNFGQSSWGTVKIGRDIGIFASDAILSDMTLLGVGTISDLATGGGNTTLGRIGTGYVYADWKAQISWASPNWDGFSMAAGVFSPWGLNGLSGTSATASDIDQKSDTPRLEGKGTYMWEGNYPGKVWVSGLYQSVDSDSGGFDDIDSWGLDAGVKVGMGAFELVAYGYTGDALGTTGYLFDAVDATGDERESKGGYIQGTYKFPGAGTKLGVSYGVSQLDTADGDSSNTDLVDENRSWIVGVYHPLTEALTLVAEYTQTTAEAHSNNEAEEKTLALGAILFY